MNDFSELEDKLKALRPTGASPELFARVERAMADSADIPNIVRPDRFRVRWFAVGAGLAAAAVVLIFSRLSIDRVEKRSGVEAAVSAANRKPTVGDTPTATLNSGFIPAGATQIVYQTRDEGLHFSGNSEEPLRRRRSITQETLRWHNAATGASLRVSYPSEQVELIPVSYQ